MNHKRAPWSRRWLGVVSLAAYVFTKIAVSLYAAAIIFDVGTASVFSRTPRVSGDGSQIAITTGGA